MRSTYSTAAAALSLLGGASAQTNASLPTVDLGYLVQRAIAVNTTGGYYNFTNIRFAQPPIGNLRFAAPVAPSGRNGTSTNGGDMPISCPQAGPLWLSIATSFIPAFIQGQGSSFDYSLANATAYANASNINAVRPQARGAQEDCLFLDVFAPTKVFDAGGGKGKGAPVLVEIYGGGFTGGSKVSPGSAAGLINASKVSGGDGVVFVAMNYRLGALGWLSGSSVQAAGVQNAGLYDQRLALQWVQDNIGKFGGDPTRVTVIGESAGASSILHQITAFGGKSNTSSLFKQAVPQSPAFEPFPDPVANEATAQEFLSILGVSSIAAARNLSSAQVIQANSYQVANAVYGTFTYGPVVDGVFAPLLPGQLLGTGQFDKTVKVMVGHNTDEGLLFSDPAVNSTADYTAYLLTTYPKASQSVLAYIEDVLYPPIFNGSYGYTTQFTRYLQTISEFVVECNTLYLDQALQNMTYSYQFDVFPAIHGQDIAYTFFNGLATNDLGLPLNSTTATAFQEYLTSFAVNGVPSAPGFVNFNTYGSNSSILDIATTNISQIPDDFPKQRCAFWQQGLFLGQEVDANGVGIANGTATLVIPESTTGTPFTGSVASPTAPYNTGIPSPVSGATPAPTTAGAGPLGGGSSTMGAGTSGMATMTGSAVKGGATEMARPRLGAMVGVVAGAVMLL